MTLSEAQAREVEEAFGDLVGLPLADVWDNLGACSFVFAETRLLPRWGALPVGREATWVLAAACEWHLEVPNEARPLVQPVRGSGREILKSMSAWIKPFLRARSLVVAGIMVRRDGALRLRLSDRHDLVVLPRGEFDMDLETVRGDRRWSLRTPEDDPRGDLLFRVGSLEWEPKGSPPMCVDYHVELPT